jgi:hypothetical protein
MKTRFFLFVGIMAAFIPGTGLFGQEYGLGGSLIYNFSSRGTGIGLRAEFPIERVKLMQGLSVVPQASYFPGFNNDYNEFYLGSSIHLGVYSHRKWLFYTLANISYRGWINYDETADENTQFSNLAAEAGLGVTRRTCLRPFMELRLNVIGAEPNIRLGLMYTFNCDIKGAVPCSKIPPQPQF